MTTTQHLAPRGSLPDWRAGHDGIYQPSRLFVSGPIRNHAYDDRDPIRSTPGHPGFATRNNAGVEMVKIRARRDDGHSHPPSSATVRWISSQTGA